MSKKKLYAIVDIETTGGAAAKSDRITEVAVALHDGTRVIDTFESLVNPERSIPYYITQHTGITDDMVANAPKFYEIAKKIVEITEGAIFVAHNVRFDYGFITEEFRRLGYSYSRRQLDTVKMARQAFPGLKSYALGNLIKHFNIDVSARHRAMADVMATVDVFERILKTQKTEIPDENTLFALNFKQTLLPEGVSQQLLDSLPETVGVYYFHDAKNEVIYVGKSINIKKRIYEHFADKTSKGEAFQRSIKDISFEETGSELIALLREDAEIKRLKPRINKAQRRTFFPYALFSYLDSAGYLRFFVAKNTGEIRKKNTILREFQSPIEGKGFMLGLVKRYQLCEHKLGTETTELRACFNRHIGMCHGACLNEEATDSYNSRVLEATEATRVDFDEDFFVFDNGNTPTENAVVLVKNGNVAGFGYIDNTEGVLVEDLYEAINPIPRSADANRILKLFLQKNTKLKKIKIS